VGLEQPFLDAFDAIPLDFPRDETLPLARGDLVLKRAFDVTLAAGLLCLLAPLLVALAVLVRLDSVGPALFRQTRLGRGGKTFEILKFRTMTVMENGARVVQARKNDPRITRIGRLLRRTSLDELPQLINVLKGEMSLVGPRPHAAAHDAYYSQLIENYCARQAVRPGITGWAQVNGYRGETPTVASMCERVRHDVWYVRHFSIGLDLKIIARTVVEVLRPRNAH